MVRSRLRTSLIQVEVEFCFRDVCLVKFYWKSCFSDFRKEKHDEVVQKRVGAFFIGAGFAVLC